MATSRKTSASKAAAAPDVSALEAKIAQLEAKLAELSSGLQQHEAHCQKVHNELDAKCEACCAAAGSSSGGSRDEGLRRQLRLYFASVNNGKIDTHIPKLD